MTDWFAALSAIVTRHEPDPDPHALPRAAAALMLEMAMTDEKVDAAELDTVHSAMQRSFGLAPEELDELMEEAHEAARQSVSLHQFTHALRTGLSPEQRGDVVEWLWRVAYADQNLDVHEEHLVRRIADLLAVPHHEYIRHTKLNLDLGHECAVFVPG